MIITAGRPGEATLLVIAVDEILGTHTFNNAGYLGGIAPVTSQSLADLDATLDVNVRGTLLCLRYELAVMLAAGGGAIVNNASLAGLVGSPDRLSTTPPSMPWSA